MPLIRSFVNLLVAGALGLALITVPIGAATAADCSTVPVTTSRVSSSILYIDTGISPQLTGSYTGYSVTNGGAPLADAWVELGDFVGGVVSLAGAENGLVHVGPLGTGETAYAYFYLTAGSETGTVQTHTLTLFEGRPDVGTAICDDSYSLTTAETIKASANKVDTVVAGPNPAVLGGIMTMTVTGQTGQVGAAGIFSATPAADPNWPADAYDLVDVQITFDTSGTFHDTLLVTGLGGSSQDYTAVYTFVASGTTTSPTSVSPVNYISSGTQIKHTDTGAFTALEPILPAENTTTLAKTVTPPTLPASGGQVTYTVTVSNTGPIDVTLDDFVDSLPTGATLLAGSARYGGAPIADPIISGQTHTFIGVFVVPAEGNETLTYDVSFPPSTGVFANSITGHVGTTPIDQTADTSDASPATADVTVGEPVTITADLSLTKSDANDPVTVGQSIAYSILVTNGGPDAAENVQVVDTLPAGLGFVSATPDQGSCSESAGTVTCDLGSVGVGTVSITIVATTFLSGTYTNTAAVDSITADPGPANNTADEVTTVQSPRPPIARDDAGVVGEDVALVVAVLDNDSDLDGDLDPASVTVTSGPTSGTTSVDPVTGAITYTPDPDYHGPDSFTYEVCDLTTPTPLCDTATVTLTVTAINDAPAASNDTASTTEDSAVVIDVVDNDSDVDGNLDPTSVSIIAGPTNGTVTVDPVTGELTYTPDPDYHGPDTITYQICDSTGACDTATVAITVNPDADPPIARDDAGVVGEDVALVVAVLDNDSDLDGDLDPASVTVTSGPTSGTTSVDPVTGAITYTPDPDYHGPDSFTYEVCDLTTPTPLCDTATVTLTVTAINDAPAASNDTASTTEDSAVVIDVVDNDSDVDGNLDPTSVSIIAGPTNGTVTVDPVTGELTYTPDPDYHGPDTITYQICDSTGACDTATVAITVNPDPDPPVANDDSTSTVVDTLVIVAVLDNDSDLDGDLDPASVTVTSGPTSGTTSVDPVTGAITYTPGSAFLGIDSFTYEVCDLTTPTPLCDTATATIDVAPGINFPVADDDAASVGEDGSVVVDVVDNDSDVDGNLDPTSVSIIAGPTNGTVTVDPVTGELTYTPDPDYHGPDTITYQICDTTAPAPLCDTATVAITVNPANDPPVANNDAVSTPEDTPVVIDVTANDTDIDDNLDPTTVTIITPPTNGTTSVDPVTGAVTYTPDPNYAGPDTFTYQVCDTTGTCSTGTANVDTTVVAIDDPPVADDDAASVGEDGSVVVDVVDNDSDVDGNLDPTSVSIIAGPTNGTVTVDPVTGELTYTPDPDYHGPDTITYQICDTTAPAPLCDTATVAITVNPANDPPVANNDAVSTPEDTPVVIDVTANDTDIDDNLDPTTVTIITPPTNGTTSVDPVTGAVTYTPDPNYAGPDTFTYQVCDTTGTCSTGTANVDTTVVAIDDPPVADDDAASVGEDGSVVVDVVDNDSDVDGNLDPTSVSIIAGPTNGTVTVDPVTGELTYTPDPDYHGPDTITYQICDTTAPAPLCDTATVAITVNPANDPPVANNDAVSTPEDTPVVIDVTANDTDIDDNLDPTTVTIITPPTNGTTSVDPVTGAVTYTPDPNYAGPDTFTYQVCDTTGTCSTGTANVDVDPVNDPPEYIGVSSISVAADDAPEPLAIVDPEGHTYTVLLLAGTLPPGLSLASDGSWVGVATEAGSYPVTLRTCDDQDPAACSDFTIVLTVSVLPVTGASTLEFLRTGLLLVAMGAALVLFARYMSRPDPATSTAR